MKIIDNKKDYYDYLASIYGIDELVVYDRRGSVTFSKNSGESSRISKNLSNFLGVSRRISQDGVY